MAYLGPRADGRDALEPATSLLGVWTSIFRPRFRLRFAILALLGLALGCGQEAQTLGDCTSDSECPTGSICRRSAGNTVGFCQCRSDESCPDGSFCNPEGVCQKRTGCRSNDDCADPTTFCDLTTGGCLARTACGYDVHCPAGTVCDASAKQCVNGCRDSGDCPIAQVCDRTGQPANAALGACIAGICEDDSYCPFGQNCVGRSCVAATHPDLCAECGGGTSCSDPTSFCLINSSHDPANPSTGAANFCGVSCTDTPSICPSGYDCGGVVLLTDDQCTDDAQCGSNRRCSIGEGDLRGFCTCNADADCAIETFSGVCQKSCGGFGLLPCERDSDCLSRNCAATCFGNGQSCTTNAECPDIPICNQGSCVTEVGRSCSTATDCLCVSGSCVNTGLACSTGADCNPPCRNGGCYLGAACAPEEGLSCVDVGGQ